MKIYTLALASAFAFTAGGALAQTTSSQSTTSVTPVAPAPPADTLSVTRSEKSTAPDGTQTNSNDTSYRNSQGSVTESSKRTTVPPAPPMVNTTTETQTDTSTGAPR